MIKPTLIVLLCTAVLGVTSYSATFAAGGSSHNKKGVQPINIYHIHPKITLSHQMRLQDKKKTLNMQIKTYAKELTELKKQLKSHKSLVSGEKKLLQTKIKRLKALHKQSRQDLKNVERDLAKIKQQSNRRSGQVVNAKTTTEAELKPANSGSTTADVVQSRPKFYQQRSFQQHNANNSLPAASQSQS